MESSIPSSPAGSAALATIKTKESSAYKTSAEGVNLRTETLINLVSSMNSRAER